jgi:hypothetical protein
MRGLWPNYFKQLEISLMSKKLLVVMLAVVGVFTLAACEKKSAPAPAAEAPAAMPAAPAAEAPAAMPAAPAAEAPAATPAPAIDKK